VTLHGVVPGSAPTPEGELERIRTREHVESLLARLDDREWYIVVRRYGLDGGDEPSQTRVGQELGITQTPAGQLERRVMQKLKGAPVRGKPKSPEHRARIAAALRRRHAQQRLEATTT
jgi:DNA-directed RNA polymerase sigma subunit (sigma70/sigma32)